MHGHEARLMPEKYVRPYSKRQKNHARRIIENDSTSIVVVRGLRHSRPETHGAHLGSQSAI